MLRSAERLAILRRLLSSDEDLGLISSRREVFYERDGAWHQSTSRTVTAPFWIRMFAFAVKKPGPHRAADTIVWGFPDLAAVIVVRLLPAAITDDVRADR